MSSYGFLEVLDIVMEEFEVQRKTEMLNVPAVFGPPGIGKSALAREAAIRDGVVTLWVINLGDNSDPTDVTGIPVPCGLLNRAAETIGDAPLQEWEDKMVSEGSTRAGGQKHIERVLWALNSCAAAACTYPVLVVHDDFDKAPDSVQKGLIGLFGTRDYRDFRLHPLSLLMAAGNRVGDDLLAGDISQSMLGRITVIEMEPRFADFEAYAKENPDQIHPEVLDFLKANPELLYKSIEDGRYTAPSPRKWWEASQHLLLNSDQSRWTKVIERKCGDGTKQQWVAWFKILKNIDVTEILHTGTTNPPPDTDKRMFEYACVFAVCRYLAKHALSTDWTGLETFVRNLQGEKRIALIAQIDRNKTLQISKMFPAVADILVKDLVDEPIGGIDANQGG